MAEELAKKEELEYDIKFKYNSMKGTAIITIITIFIIINTIIIKNLNNQFNF